MQQQLVQSESYSYMIQNDVKIIIVLLFEIMHFVCSHLVTE